MKRITSTTLATLAIATAPLSIAAEQSRDTSGVWQQFVAQGNQLRANFDRELRATQVEQAFAVLKRAQTPTRGELAEAEARVAAAEKKYAEFGPQYDRMLRSTCERLMAVSPRDGRDCQASLVDSPVARRFELQRRYYGELRSLFQFLSAKWGAYSATPQGFRFQASADTAAFNGYLDKLVATEDEGRAMQQQGDQALQRMQAQFGSR